MTRARLIDVNQRFVNDGGVLEYEPRLLMESLNAILTASINNIYCVRRFDSLAQLQAEIKQPQRLPDSPVVMITGQGLAVYSKALAKWVKASDDTTPIA